MSSRLIVRTTTLAVAAIAVLSLASSPAVGIVLPDPAVDANGNLLANASFEIGDPAKHPDSWVFAATPAAQSASLNSAAANVHSGHASLQIVDPDDNNISIRNANVTGIAGVSYTAKAWVKNGSGSTAVFYLEFLGTWTGFGSAKCT